MQFVNHTPFPALAFGGVDQHEQDFHVVVLRQTLTWDKTGQLTFADAQAPLCEADETFDGSLHGCVRQESDLCQYKPHCDVIVNADAHAPLGPNGKPAARFQVRLMVKRPDTQLPLPPEPQGPNPRMSPGPEATAKWQAEVEAARRTWVPGERLVDKILQVTGERHFARDGGLQRGVDSTIMLASLGLVRPSSWRLTEPGRQASVPLRLDRAFGGQCRVEAGTPEAGRVPAAHRLTAEQAAGHPDADGPPVAHDAFAPNPAGRGFASDWFLNATGAQRIPAPQVEYANRPITLDDFMAARRGQLLADPALVAGLGVRPKGHPERARLVGRVDRDFIQRDAALPRDFDFAVWNAAWPDQQTEYLQGNEVIGLMNLCAAETPGSWVDEQGNVLLRLDLPGHCVQMLVRLASGEMFMHPAQLDTLLLEPAQQRLSLVWRCVLAKFPEAPIRALEAWSLNPAQRDALQRQQDSIGALLDNAAAGPAMQPAEMIDG